MAYFEFNFRVINVKPKDDSFSGHVSRFDANTTYHDGFQEKSGEDKIFSAKWTTGKQLSAEKLPMQRTKDELHVGEGKFYGETTQHSDFIEKHVDICPAEKVLTRRYFWGVIFRRTMKFQRSIIWVQKNCKWTQILRTTCHSWYNPTKSPRSSRSLIITVIYSYFFEF